MTHETLFAGFGGQGVLLAGRLLVYAGMIAGKEGSFMPAYGPEMRGGTASCSVIVSDEPVGSPVINKPELLVALNKPSLHKFEPLMQPGGVVIINSSLIDEKAARTDIKAYYVPMNDMAQKLGNPKALNMVALGALLGATKMLDTHYFRDVLAKNFASKPEIIDSNMKALESGIEFINSYSG